MNTETAADFEALREAAREVVRLQTVVDAAIDNIDDYIDAGAARIAVVNAIDVLAVALELQR